MDDRERVPQLFAPEDLEGIRWRELAVLCDFAAAVRRAKAAGYSEYVVRRSFRRLSHGGVALRKILDAAVDAAFGLAAGGDDAAVH